MELTAERYVIVQTTLPGETDASAFARALVTERLAACVHVLAPMTSTYRWKGTIEEEPERQLSIKTSRGCIDALWQRVRELHPYEVPEFVVLPIIDGSEAYLRWISENTDAG
ncbi:MAG: divalent-cation tolerance protein CutA [Tepidisphaeraceae bacterium]